jgi:hydrogenase large subunit
MATAHYLEALDFQKEIVKVHTIFGGKNPHPNWLVGGVPCSFNLDGVGAVGAINMERLNLVAKVIDDTIAFIDQVYVPDLLAIASFYKDWGAIGGGISSQNLLCYGEFPDIANDDSNKSLLMPRGAILGGNLKEIHPVSLKDVNLIQEHVNHSWYKYADETKGLHPWDGVTEPSFVLGKGTKGTKTDIKNLDESAKYSWVKSPRFKGQPMEVGPLARYVMYYAMGVPEFKEPVDMVLKKLDVPVQALFSTLGRTAARGLEASWSAHKMKYFFDKLMTNLKNGNRSTANVDSWEPRTWPAEAKGAGYCEAPRGALGHWIKIRNTKIDNYQCIVPTTWNAGPRDAKNQIGAYEASLMNTKVAKADEPLEIIRTIHSFDPCLACATHVISPEGEEITRVTVR